MNRNFENTENTMTVGELLDYLSKFKREQPVHVWLPGSRIRLSPMLEQDGTVLIEGNVNEGSALSA
jgi:hypothetical protein